MNLEKYSLHTMDVLLPEPVPREITRDPAGIQEYISIVIRDLTIPKKGQDQIKGQYFNFNSMQERVAKNILKMAFDDQNWEEHINDNASKLHSVELAIQEEIERLSVNIRKGGFLQVKRSNSSQIELIMIKVDDTSILDQADLEIKTGLPLETRVQKAAIVTIDKSSNSVIKLLLSDTNNTISKYWSRDFFESSPIRTPELNTTNAFSAIDRLLKKQVLNVSKQDYYFLRNIVITEFRKESLDFNNLVEDLKVYTPESPKLTEKYNDFIEKLTKLPTKNINKSFDTQFDIDPKSITARLNKNTIIIDDHFELKVKGDLLDLGTKIGADSDAHGKYVKLYSDVGYETFKKGSGSV